MGPSSRACANVIGTAASSMFRVASSRARSVTYSPMRASAAARSSGDVRGHGPLSNASRAAATARSTSALVARGTYPMTSSVDGEITSMRPPSAAGTHAPPMYS